jgi:hypothetical protein
MVLEQTLTAAQKYAKDVIIREVEQQPTLKDRLDRIARLKRNLSDGLLDQNLYNTEIDYCIDGFMQKLRKISPDILGTFRFYGAENSDAKIAVIAAAEEMLRDETDS